MYPLMMPASVAASLDKNFRSRPAALSTEHGAQEICVPRTGNRADISFLSFLFAALITTPKQKTKTYGPNHVAMPNFPTNRDSQIAADMRNGV